MKGRFLHITDTHFAASSNVRTGDYLDDLITKLDWVVAKANELDATIIHSGDFFDKPTVPDEVKTRVIQSLKRAKYTLVLVIGNHDRLYGSDSYKERTSLMLMQEAGFIKSLEVTGPIEYDDCVVVTARPLTNHTSNKPQIALYHGFLNQEDGLSSYDMQDVYSDTPNLLLLGHDHVPHEAVQYKNTIIIRPGSFCRAIRNDSSDRIPECGFIEIKEGIPNYTIIPIDVAKPVNLLFKHKVKTQQKTTIDSYTDIVAMLKQDKKGITLYDALEKVTEKEIINHIKFILEDG